MKLGDIFSKLGNIELVKLVRWYGFVVLGAFGAFIAVIFCLAIYYMAASLIAMLPWYGWVLVLLAISAFTAVQLTNKPSPEEDWDGAYIRGKIYTENDGK